VTATGSAVRVRVPASSANLGPGFDSFALALGLYLQLEVRAVGEFSVDAQPPHPRTRANLCVRAFERICPADGLAFTISSQIPLSGGLGSSAAAIVAGLAAADALSGAGADLLALASELEGHPDNVAASLYGGFVICADGRAARLEPPDWLSLLVVVPTQAVSTRAARAALPARVPMSQAVFNVAHGALLAAGIARGDRELVARGLSDRLHQDRRAHLFTRSHELLGRACELGALGATISGAGAAVLVWCEAAAVDGVTDALRAEVADWAEVIGPPVASHGVQVG
jgi:homoserine kinase